MTKEEELKKFEEKLKLWKKSHRNNQKSYNKLANKLNSLTLNYEAMKKSWKYERKENQTNNKKLLKDIKRKDDYITYLQSLLNDNNIKYKHQID
jgi:hypothetical protein